MPTAKNDEAKYNEVTLQNLFHYHHARQGQMYDTLCLFRATAFWNIVSIFRVFVPPLPLLFVCSAEDLCVLTESEEELL